VGPDDRTLGPGFEACCVLADGKVGGAGVATGIDVVNPDGAGVSGAGLATGIDVINPYGAGVGGAGLATGIDVVNPDEAGMGLWVPTTKYLGPV
jgi:hypothetical protein